MRRRHRPGGFVRKRVTLRQLGLLALMGFALYAAFKIFQEPTVLIETVRSPDGSREARIEYVYHTPQPYLRLLVRRGWGWRTIQVFPPLEDEPAEERRPSLQWSHDSRRLFLLMDGQPVWAMDFDID